LDFATISSHQQADVRLQWIKQSNNDYETHIIGRTPIVYLRDKIVVPQSLQRRIVDWYHTMLAHLNLAKTIEDAICRTTCLTKVRWTLRVPGYHRARRAS
jgi:hypothetical protein